MAQVIWAEPALSDLDAIADYIALDNPTAARDLVKRIFMRADQLVVHPDSGSKPRELRGGRYRQLDLASGGGGIIANATDAGLQEMTRHRQLHATAALPLQCTGAIRGTTNTQPMNDTSCRAAATPNAAPK